MALQLKPTILAVALGLIALLGLAACSAPPQATEASAPVITATSAPATSAAQPGPVITVTPVPATEPAIDPTPMSVPLICAKLNLNEVTQDQLMNTIPDFPNRMVREFFEYRPYVSIQQFRREIGKYVDQAQVSEWEKYVYVPVDPNQSDADTLMQMPGVDATVAASMVSGRPYASTQAFLDVLVEHVSPEQFAGATCYLSQ